MLHQHSKSNIAQVVKDLSTSCKRSQQFAESSLALLKTVNLKMLQEFMKTYPLQKSC